MRDLKHAPKFDACFSPYKNFTHLKGAFTPCPSLRPCRLKQFVTLSFLAHYRLY